MAEGKFVGNVIKLPEAVIRFVRVYKAEVRTKDGRPKMRMNKKTNSMEPDLRYSLTALLDPSKAVHAEKIVEIKAEGTRAMNHIFGSIDKWPKPDPETGRPLPPIFCFGQGNKLPKVYDGFKDMFYVKLSTPDYNRPLIWTRRYTPVVQESDDQAPYDGSVCNVSLDLWPFNNESAGVNGNLREVQFVKDGKEYSGGRRAGDDFAALGDEPQYAAGAAAGKDPFD